MLLFAIGGSEELPKLEDMEAILDNMVEDTMDITAIMAITVTLVTIKVIILITDPIFTTVAADILEMVADFITGRNKKSWLRIFTQNSSHVQFWKPYSQTIESVENDVKLLQQSVLKFPFWVSISKALKSSSSWSSFESVCWGVAEEYHCYCIFMSNPSFPLKESYYFPSCFLLWCWRGTFKKKCPLFKKKSSSSLCPHTEVKHSFLSKINSKSKSI